MTAMAGVRMKDEYGPSLARLLAPWWRASSRAVRVGVVLALAGLVVLLVAVGLTLENASYSHGGPVPFGFEYRYLYRVAPDPGGYVKVQSHYPGGALKYSYAADPLALPAYSETLQGELPLYATGFIAGLARRYPDFVLRGQGKAKVNNTLIGYQVAFTARVQGSELWGRDLLFFPPAAKPREGVLVAMLSAPGASQAVLSPLEVGESGVLLRPLKTFTFG
jgi:hypothetical protein